MTLVAEQVAHAQARIRALIESGKLTEATAFARVNGIEEEWVQECYGVWLQRQAKPEHEKPPEESWVTKFRRLKFDTETAGPQIDEALKVSGKAKADDAASLDAAIAKLDAAKAEPQAEPEPEPKAQTWDVNPPMLSRASPLDSARLFAKAKLYQRGVLATYYHRRQWWQWNGRFYAPIADDRVIASVTLFLDGARTADGEARFKPKSRDTEELVKALRVHCLIEDAPPQWLDGREDDASRLLVFRNCLVDCETGKVSALTPKLWVHGGVDIDYDPQALCPRWEEFLREVFPGDAESQQCIEEQLGYGMTHDTRFEKGALWIGVKRSGKTTIAWVQEQLVGSGACANLSFHTWVTTENSHANIIGKKVGLFSDVRLKPSKTYGMTGYDPGGIDHKSAQLLLNIIGRDTISVGRKYDPEPWQGRPTIKIIMTSNEVPNLQDAGGVLASRFIKVAFKRSFSGKEDVNLRGKLAGELPGIAVRCLAAYRRLLKRGRFIQPRSAAELERKIEERVNPYLQFMNDCFEEDLGGEGVWVASFYDRFLMWCDDNCRYDLKGRVPKQKLIGHINEIERWRDLKSTRTNSGPRRYPGIKSRKAE